MRLCATCCRRVASCWSEENVLESSETCMLLKHTEFLGSRECGVLSHYHAHCLCVRTLAAGETWVHTVRAHGPHGPKSCECAQCGVAWGVTLLGVPSCSTCASRAKRITLASRHSGDMSRDTACAHCSCM